MVLKSVLKSQSWKVLEIFWKYRIVFSVSLNQRMMNKVSDILNKCTMWSNEVPFDLSLYPIIHFSLSWLQSIFFLLFCSYFSLPPKLLLLLPSLCPCLPPFLFPLPSFYPSSFPSSIFLFFPFFHLLQAFALPIFLPVNSPTLCLPIFSCPFRQICLI